MNHSKEGARRRIAQCVLGGVLLLGTAGCNSDPEPASSSTPGASASERATVQGQKASPTGPVAVSTQIPSLPLGVYRISVRTDDILAAGGDALVGAGTWTLKISRGEYRLECRPIDDPGQDCGTSLPTQTLMEIGPLRGEGDQVWFLPDMPRKAKMIGCEVNSQGPNGCGGNDPYRFTWSTDGPNLRLRDFVGLGDQIGAGPFYASFTYKPWKKIG